MISLPPPITGREITVNVYSAAIYSTRRFGQETIGVNEWCNDDAFAPRKFGMFPKILGQHECEVDGRCLVAMHPAQKEDAIFNVIAEP